MCIRDRLDTLGALLQDLLPGPAKLILELGVADGDLNDHPFGATVQGHVNVPLGGPDKGVDLRLGEVFTDLCNGAVVRFGHGRHARLDAGDPHLHQLFGDAQLVVCRKDHAGGLFPVPQGGVVDDDRLFGTAGLHDLLPFVEGAGPPGVLSVIALLHVSLLTACLLYTSRCV